MRYQIRNNNHLKNKVMYKVPKNLLSSDNAKTIKGEVLNYKTYILYLAPHTQNSKQINLCPFASKGCAKACLYNSGSARFSNIQKGRINKTEYFLNNRTQFLFQLDAEISLIEARHYNDVMLPTIRLNGTSDIPFEKFLIRDGKNIFELHPNVQFYDYTKNPIRIRKEMPKNYHLTFSMSEDNFNTTFELLHEGKSASIVFDTKRGKELPSTYLGYKIIDGDVSDLRFLDDKNVIVGLRYKRVTIKGADNNIADNGFIIKVA